LTTVDNGSPLRTDTWSDSSLSSATFNKLSPSVIGKKRSHPHAAKGKARRVEEELQDYESSDLQHPPSSSHERRSITPCFQPQALERLESVSTSDAAGSIDIAHSTSGSERNEDNEREQTPQKEKRRKVTKSRLVNSPRPVGNRTSRTSPPAMRMQPRKQRRGGGRHLLPVPASPTKRRSGRLKAGNTQEERRKNVDGVSTKSLVHDGAT
jgi:hypothetical protein